MRGRVEERGSERGVRGEEREEERGGRGEKIKQGTILIFTV